MFKYVYKTIDKDLVLLFDDEDKWIIDNYSIYYNKKTGYFLCYSKTDKKSPPIYLHRLIGKVPKGKVGDHIEGDLLDFRRKSIQAISPADNARKQKKTEIYNGNPTSSEYKGVNWNRKLQKWYAYIRVNGVLLNLGNYSDPKIAAATYNVYARLLFGKFVNLNKVDVTKSELARIDFVKLDRNARKNLIAHGKIVDANKLNRFL